MLKNKKLHFELLTEVKKSKNLLRFTNSMVALFLFNFWVINSKLNNKKLHFELLTRG